MAESIIRAGWIVDGSGGPILKNSFLRFNESGIESISDEMPATPSRETILDFSGHTILPGLVDAHAHMAISGSTDGDTRKHQLEAEDKEVTSWISRHIRRYLDYGVMAVRDGGDRKGLALGFKSARNAEALGGFVLQSSGPAWHRQGRYGGFIGKAVSEKGGLSDAIRSQSIKPDHIKVINSGINSLKKFGLRTRSQFEADELREAVTAAGEFDRRVMVHANGEEPVSIAVGAGCHSIEHGFFMGEENLRKMASRRVTWVPTACTIKACAMLADEIESFSHDVCMRTLELQIEQIRKAFQFGVPVAVGTDAGSIGVFHGKSMIEEMRLFLDAGCSTAGMVRCASANGAELMGLKNTGRLTPGSRANFVVVKGSPELLPESLEKISAFFIEGRQVQNHS